MAVVSVDEDEILGWSRDPEVWLDDDHLILLRGWAQDGYTLDDICSRIGITRHKLFGWRKRYPPIADALACGKEMVDYKVENALLKSALGGRKREVRVTTIMRKGKVVEVQKEEFETEREPVEKAIEFWLTNRLPDKWKRDRQKMSLEDQLGDGSIHIEVVRASKQDDDEADSDWQETEPGNDSTAQSTSPKKSSNGNTDNKKITLRKATESEKKATKKAKKEAERARKQAEQPQKAANIVLEPSDPDYWPPDWEDDD